MRRGGSLAWMLLVLALALGGECLFRIHLNCGTIRAGTSYVAAVERAVFAAGHVVVDMADFPAADRPASELCAERVRGCDVYVGVLGTRYGSPVRDRPEVSYTELEFDTATAAGLPRLMFLLDTDSADIGIPVSRLIDREFGDRQEAFRRRVRIAAWLRRRLRTRLGWRSWWNARCGNWPRSPAIPVRGYRSRCCGCGTSRPVTQALPDGMGCLRQFGSGCWPGIGRGFRRSKVWAGWARHNWRSSTRTGSLAAMTWRGGSMPSRRG